MKQQLLLVTLCAALFSGACIQATFVQTGRFKHVRRDKIEWYIDKAPKVEYRAVGIIEVTYPADTNLMEVVRAAYDKGREVGCHLIVDRTVHRISSVELPTISFTLVRRARSCQYGTGGYRPYYSAPQPAPAYGSAPPPGKREFICGIYEPT